jgi:predicted alpha/beta-hydrolase family hydrolase
MFVAALAASPCALPQELVSVPTRPGVTQPFVILSMQGREPAAIALLYIGGGGRINARNDNGNLTFGARNFLPRSGAEFARNGVLPVVMDAPSDQRELSDGYREGSEQTADARVVIAELKRRYPGLPLYIVGTSRGTISAAYIGRDLGAEVDGVVLTSSLFGGPKRQVASLRGFDYGKIRSRLLFVHHREDGCEHTPYAAAARLGARYDLVSVSGGRSAESAPCEPFSAHGYFGKEAATVDAMAAWMLKRPFLREIE